VLSMLENGCEHENPAFQLGDLADLLKLDNRAGVRARKAVLDVIELNVARGA